MVSSQIKYINSHKISSKNKFLTDKDFVETQIKVEQIYQQKQKQVDENSGMHFILSKHIQKNREKLQEKFKQEDIERNKEAEINEYLQKQRLIQKREQIKLRLEKRRLQKLEKNDKVHKRYYSQSAPKSKPLYLKIEQKFKEEFELPEIQNRQK